MKKILAALLLPAALTLVAAGSPPSAEEEVLALTRQLLQKIYLRPSADFYAAHVDPAVTAFEGTPARIDGIDYHLFALKQLAAARQDDGAARHLELLNPKVQLYGDAAVVTLTSLVTTVRDGKFDTSYLHETRVWVHQAGEWKLVHFHKSPVTGAS